MKTIISIMLIGTLVAVVIVNVIGCVREIKAKKETKKKNEDSNRNN